MGTSTNHNQVFRLFSLLVVLLCAHLVRHATQAESTRIISPLSKRTEGRVTLEYFKNEEKIKYQLAFSEVVDSTTRRSKVTIGYVSYDPIVYYSRDGNMLMVDKHAGCVNLRQMDHMFVPQLDWFIKLSYTNAELEQGLPADRRHHIGPTGLALLLGKESKPGGNEVHRNVQCRVLTTTHDKTKAKDILYEVFIPRMYESSRVQIFSFRETAKNIVNTKRDKISTILTVDYFYTEKIDTDDAQQRDRLEKDLNLPFGVGCSQFVAPTRPQAPASQSFVMTYAQNSLQSVISLAYDHKSNYLRKEVVGGSVGVWDLNEDLFYHVDRKAQGKLTNDVDYEVPLEECSVISVEAGGGKQQPESGEPSTDSIMKPYKQSASSLDVLEFLGATSVHYVGLATVRDMPCLVFETVLSEAPKVFSLDLRADLSPNSNAIDYIVLYYVFKTNTIQYDQPGRRIGQDQREDGSYAQSSVPQIGDQFWPARISLIKRNKGTGQTKVYDRLEITDFHWGLFGLARKPSELFMMPECFDDEQEQLSVSLELLFNSEIEIAENQKLLRFNKYKLEKDLVDDLFSVFQMSLLHLTEFELALQQRSVLASLVISDRIEDKLLTYFGSGELPDSEAHLNNRVAIQIPDKSDHGGESSCLLLAVHVSQVSMIIFCPRQSEVEEPTCTAVYGESQPVIKKPVSPSSSADSPEGNGDPLDEPTACRVYRLEPREPPKSGTNELIKIKQALRDHTFRFEMIGSATSDSSAREAPKRVTLTGMIHEFDVSHQLQLISISNYKYALDLTQGGGGGGGSANGEPVVEKQLFEVGKVRAFDTINYNNLGDCWKMCNLDASCKSYSYCNDDKLFYGKCILASLDLRANNVEQQLVTTKLIEGKQVVVRDLESKEGQTGPNEYRLELNSACNIYERDSLSMFVETDEVVRIQETLQNQYMTATSVVECAQSIIALEQSQVNYHSALFAYCPTTGSCLVDERLFGTIESGSSSASSDQTNEDVDGPQDGPPETLCQVYRKRYQTYFHVSPLVLKRVPQEEDGSKVSASTKTSLIRQTDLQFNTVEECAHACWDSFGHACLSFDYCLPQNCVINLINANAAGSMSAKDIAGKLDYEARMGCLHYERDLALDELRRANLIGHHKPLDLPQGNGDQESKPAAEGRSFLSVLLYYIATGALFVVGLVIGDKFHKRVLVPVNQRRAGQAGNQISSNGGATSSKSAFSRMSLSSLMRRGAGRRGSTSSRARFNMENEIYEETGAIQLEDLGERTDADADELTTTHKQTDKDAAVSSSPTPSTNTYQSIGSKTNEYDEVPADGLPTRIDVPNLMVLK